jgi:hypothetical protein
MRARNVVEISVKEKLETMGNYQQLKWEFIILYASKLGQKSIISSNSRIARRKKVMMKPIWKIIGKKRVTIFENSTNT